MGKGLDRGFNYTPQSGSIGWYYTGGRVSVKAGGQKKPPAQTDTFWVWPMWPCRPRLNARPEKLDQAKPKTSMAAIFNELKRQASHTSIAI